MPTTSTAIAVIPTVVSGASVIVAVGLVIAVTLIGRNRRRAASTRRGLLAGTSLRTRTAPVPSTTTELRLRELDEQQHRRVISPEEYVRAREKVLSGG